MDQGDEVPRGTVRQMQGGVNVQVLNALATRTPTGHVKEFRCKYCAIFV